VEMINMVLCNLANVHTCAEISHNRLQCSV
jgi:hypothetical protein